MEKIEEKAASCDSLTENEDSLSRDERDEKTKVSVRNTAKLQ